MGRNQTELPRKPEDLLFPLLLSRSMARQGKQGRSLPWMQNTVHHPVYFCKPDGAFFMENCILFLHG